MASLPLPLETAISPKSKVSAIAPLSGWSKRSPVQRSAALLAFYAVGFWLTHAMAAPWGGEGYYSLWFPAAGLRIALLWGAGVRFAPAAALVELFVDTLDGAIDLTGASPALVLLGVVRPALAYGLAIAAIRRLASGARAGLFVAPMPLGLAIVLAPVAAALAALPQALWVPEMTGVRGDRAVLLSLTEFAVGDLLGALVLAPPILWAADLLSRGRTMSRPHFRVAAVVEAAAVLLVAILVTGMLLRLDLGLQPMPALLGVAWIGLRFGRAAAWGALLVLVASVLPRTAGPMADATRLELHLALATVVVAGYLAGSFADAQARARADLARRDRLLFQAERLKTVRAMSVAVIHEISQPLSTLAIEARHLHEMLGATGSQLLPDIADTAELIDRKAAALSELVRRLRRFGGRAADEPSPLLLAALIATVRDLTAAEAKTARVTLEIGPCDPDLMILAQEVELAQAVVNLVRNAIQAQGGGQVQLTCTREGECVRIAVANRLVGSRSGDGMGVGLLIARAIVEAHDGRLERIVDGEAVIYTLFLSLFGDPA